MTTKEIEYVTTECPNGHRVRGDVGWLNRDVHCPHCQQAFVFSRPQEHAAKVTVAPEPPRHKRHSLSDTGVMRILDGFGKPAPRESDGTTRHCPQCGADFPSDVSICYGCNIELDPVKTVEPATPSIVDESVDFEPLSTFPYDDISVRRVMRPRKEIVYLNSNDSLAQVQTRARESQHACFPVCDGSLDHVLGFVSLPDVTLVDAKTFDLRSNLKSAVKLVDETRVSDAITILRQLGKSTALVVDEYETIIGLVTLKQMLLRLLSK